MMKLYKIFFITVFAILPGIIQAELCLIDTGAVVVCGPERNTMIVDTDTTWKRSLEGSIVPLQQQIQNDIVAQQVVADRLPLDPTAADKYVENLKKQNNLTDSDLVDLFDGVGRTFTEGIQLLNDQYVHEMFMHHKFKSQLVPTDDEIAAYNKENPQYVDGWCQIEVAYFDFTDESKKDVRKSLDSVVAGKPKKDFVVQWSAPITVKDGDIAEDKKFILDMNIGQIAVQEVGNTFEVYKLLGKEELRLKSMDECRSSIIDQLNKDKLTSMLNNYNKEVRKFIDVINLDERISIQG